MMRKLALAAIVALAIPSVPSYGGEAAIRAAQETIDAQIKAFLADDGALAYSYAAPGIRQLFPSVEIFMGMVESGYMPVRRPQDYSFGKSEEAGGVVLQQVMIVGPDGRDYEALYTLEVQPDGVWRITSVSLRRSGAIGT
jgi:hypothetical protein